MKTALAILSLSLVLSTADRLAAADAGGQQRSGPPPAAKDDAEKKILDLIHELEPTGRQMLNVPPWDGRVLRILAEAVGAKQVVEIGTSNGYSGLWFCLALRTTGGKLTTFDIDEKKVQIAKENFKKAGVDGLVEVVLGNAHEKVKELKGPVDIVFIDAEKEGYVDYLKAVLPLVRPGGLILAHNVRREPGQGDPVEKYVEAAGKDPALETVLLMGGGGLSLSLKKR
jgi:caffeoyl-CoA O-methyltransferase